jgi:hypothetical protein
LIRKENKMENTKKYAFCETVTAGPLSKWHIRKLSDKGPKFGGGADTLSLCGTTITWDIDVKITEHHLTVT